MENAKKRASINSVRTVILINSMDYSFNKGANNFEFSIPGPDIPGRLTARICFMRHRCAQDMAMNNFPAKFPFALRQALRERVATFREVIFDESLI